MLRDTWFYDIKSEEYSGMTIQETPDSEGEFIPLRKIREIFYLR